MSRALTVDQIVEFSGLYDEEVGKIVDGLEEGILHQEFSTQESVLMALTELVLASDWVHVRPWLLYTLLFSENGIEVLQEHGELPLATCAREALRRDCLEKLNAVPAFQKLRTPV